jgi:hypothetical protein
MSNYKTYFLYKDILIIFCFLSLLFVSSCSPKIYSQKVDYSFKSKNGMPDYSNLNYWAAHPYKNDPSDNTPSGFADQMKDTLADVFFVYPTTYTDTHLPEGWNANIDDEALNKKTDNSAILYQASVFNKY